ncbi:MAG: hypothetical protein GXO88_02435 [Chlorobi bacterium]|nr:hypothetical protein [Chlorobiota bacterium]
MKQLILVLVIIPSFFFGQGWEKTFGGEHEDSGHSVQQTTDGGYIITGSYQFGNVSYDVYLIKTDSNGDTLWTKIIGGEGWEQGHSVQQTTDGGYIITGSTNSYGSGDFDAYLIKTDSNGDTLWTKTFGGEYNDEGWSVQQTTDGGYIITGFINSYGSSGFDVFLIKTNDEGDTLWTKIFGGGGDDQGYSVQQTNDGGYIIAGNTNSFGFGNNDIYIIRTDSNGDSLWSQTFGGYGWEMGYSVQQTTDDGYIIIGSTNSYSSSDFDVYLIKTDNNGNLLWDKVYVDYFDDIGYSVQQTTDGGYIITGLNTQRTNYYDEYESINLIKTDSNGNTLWTKLLGGGDNDVGYSLQQTTDGGYIITGYSQTFGIGNGDKDVCLIKTDENGIITFTTEIPVPNPNRRLIKRIDLSGKEILKPKKNQPYIEIYDDGTNRKKIKLK